MERLEKNAYQEKLVRGLLNSLRENYLRRTCKKLN